MIKFDHPTLTGYGFDVAADRVVRFNKYSDGTYLNTRATYSINKMQFTHFGLREIALKQEVIPTTTVKPRTNKHKWFIIGVIVITIAFLTDCSFEFNSDVTINSIEETV